ncbi:alpha/beta fold hydrolase [Sulfitobacter sp.]|uniref:alpha/beta fold hydrolase n=1 Tax=Sulfitobacter sp. TaxID=1903071 RepID=UPI003002FFA3
MTWTIQPRSKFGRLAAITGGSGPKVLLVHGVGLRAEAWGGQLEILARTCRVMAVDMPGHGESSRLASNPQMADFTDAIVMTLTEPVVVIGHSFGAMIALDMASRYSDLVLGVAALNGIFQRDVAAKDAVLARAASLDGKITADPNATLIRWFGAEPSGARSACQEWLSEVDPAGYRDAYHVFAAEDGPSDKALRNLQCPALFLTGEDEPNSTPQMSRRMAESTPFGRAAVLKGAAHMLPMTHATEVTAILEKFIQDTQIDEK